MGFSTAARALATRRRTSSILRSLPFAYFSSRTSTQISCAGIDDGTAVDRSFAFILQTPWVGYPRGKAWRLSLHARLRSTGGCERCAKIAHARSVRRGAAKASMRPPLPYLSEPWLLAGQVLEPPLPAALATWLTFLRSLRTHRLCQLPGGTTFPGGAVRSPWKGSATLPILKGFTPSCAAGSLAVFSD